MLKEEKFAVSSIERVDRLSKGIDRLAVPGVDAVLLDLGLPDSQGLNTFERVHAAAEHIPILILTAFEDDAVALESVRRGAQDYLIKGKIDAALLVRAITYAVERKKLEETVEKRTVSLKRSEEKYRTLFDSIDEGFCIVEVIFDDNYRALDYRFLEVNASFERQTGMHDAKGKMMRSFAPNHEAHWFEIYGKVALTGESVRFTNEAKELNRWYDVFAFPVGEGKPRKVGIIFNDITQRKRIEKQLQDQERLAAIGATAGMVGHDIRNPLQSISGDIYLLKSDISSVPEGEEKESMKESLADIETNVAYVNKIVQDLQDFAKPIRPNAREVNLEALCESILPKNSVPDNVDASCRAEKEVKTIVTDPDMLKRILSNLVNNSIQAMPNGGKILLHAYHRPDHTVISVHDTGLGIPEEIRPKLFSPLFTTKSRGQGFGLAVVKRMTEALGGTVAFESSVGKGTTFFVRLPHRINENK